MAPRYTNPDGEPDRRDVQDHPPFRNSKTSPMYFAIIAHTHNLVVEFRVSYKNDYRPTTRQQKINKCASGLLYAFTTIPGDGGSLLKTEFIFSLSIPPSSVFYRVDPFSKNECGGNWTKATTSNDDDEDVATESRLNIISGPSANHLRVSFSRARSP